MWLKVKLFFAAAAGVVMAVLYGLLQREKKVRAQEKAKAEKKAREVESKGAEATVQGLEREQQVRNAKIDTTKRNHFS